MLVLVNRGLGTDLRGLHCLQSTELWEGSQMLGGLQSQPGTWTWALLPGLLTLTLADRRLGPLESLGTEHIQPKESTRLIG